MTKSFEERAREWMLNNQFYNTGATIVTKDWILNFASWLDQEAQEKPCRHEWSSLRVIENPKCKICGVTFLSVAEPMKPQQPEEIKISQLSGYADNKAIADVGRKLNEVIRTLNRLIHKD